MIADLELMKKLTHGAVRVTQDEEGFKFYRMTAQQMKTYESNRDFYIKSQSAAGIRFDIVTDAKKIVLECSSRPGSSRLFSYVDAAVNGVLVQHSGTENMIDEPDLTMEVELDGALNTVTIYLSGLSRMTVKKLEIIGAERIEPVKKSKVMICFGDSITHGYDAVYPSLAYPNQLADALDAEMYNKGIGAEIFNPALLDEPDPVKPDLITVAYGTNDWSKRAAGELEANATAFFDRLSVLYPGVPVYAILPLWRADWNRTTACGTFAQGREIVRKAAARHPRCRIIDGMKLIPHIPEYFSDKYLHPNDSGFMFMARELLQELRTDWQNYQLAQTCRKREAIEWSIYYHFNTGDKINPRLLLIGDSICNGYHGAVRKELASDANISFWAGSKCVTDPEYLQELSFLLSSYRYDFISFNNGLHSLSTVPEEYQEAYRNVVRYIRAKCPDAKLVITTSTPCFSEEKTAKVRKLNEVALAVASEMDLEVFDLFAHLDPLDRETNWRDEYHYQPDAIGLQGRVIADFFRPRLNSTHNVKQQGTETGPDGAIRRVLLRKKSCINHLLAFVKTASCCIFTDGI